MLEEPPPPSPPEPLEPLASSSPPPPLPIKKALLRPVGKAVGAAWRPVRWVAGGIATPWRRPKRKRGGAEEASAP